jgi:hypothetical protein
MYGRRRTTLTLAWNFTKTKMKRECWRHIVRPKARLKVHSCVANQRFLVTNAEDKGAATKGGTGSLLPFRGEQPEGPCQIGERERFDHERALLNVRREAQKCGVPQSNP